MCVCLCVCVQGNPPPTSLSTSLLSQEALRSSLSSLKSATECDEKDLGHDGVTAALICLQDLTIGIPGVSRGRDLYFITYYKKKVRKGRHL